eukprot:403341742
MLKQIDIIEPRGYILTVQTLSNPSEAIFKDTQIRTIQTYYTSRFNFQFSRHEGKFFYFKQ